MYRQDYIQESASPSWIIQRVKQPKNLEFTLTHHEWIESWRDVTIFLSKSNFSTRVVR
jgi:hypothetical protein